MGNLRINLGDEYKIKIEESENFYDSIFAQVYETSAKNVDDIVEQATLKRNWYKESKISDFINSDDYNNVVAFTGERGSGKSSSMVSFAEALVQNSKTRLSYFKNYEYINKAKFLSIEMIDPSLFNTHDTLLEIIISKMFLKFQKHLETSNSGEFDFDKKRIIIELFQKVFENLKTLHNEKKIIYDHEAIDALSKLANGTNLKENLRILTEHFLNYFQSGDGLLLIVIDDFDLNIKGAYNMLEDIRQYLMQSNIIILLACKIEQLEDTVKQCIIRENKILFKSDPDIEEDVENRSIKYLEKLIPIDHRKYCPNVLKNSSTIAITVFEKSTIIIKSDTIQDGILQFVFNHTGLFISKPENGYCSFLPNTLRGIVNFLKSFKITSPIDNELLKNYKKSQNLDFLKNYILKFRSYDNNKLIENEEFTPSYLSKLLLDIDTKDNKQLNQYLSHWLTLLNSSDEPVTVESLNANNSSYGDVVSGIINSLSRTQISDNLMINFYEKLKMYYSIRIIEIINGGNDLKNILAGEILSESFTIFPKIGGSISRDRFKFSSLRSIKADVENLKIEPIDYYSFTSFISFLGANTNKSKEADYILYLRDADADNAVFNCFSFIINSLFPEMILNKFNIKAFPFEEEKIYIEILEWKKELNANFYILFNPNFFIEFLYHLDYYAKILNRELVGNYQVILYNYLVRGVAYSLTKMQLKYRYLPLIDVRKRGNSSNLEYADINLYTQYISNPILKYWETLSDEENKVTNLNDLINLAIENSVQRNRATSEALKRLATSQLSRYSRYFNSNSKITSQGAKQAMNNLISNFKEHDAVHKRLLDFRRLMDSNYRHGLTEIALLLNKMVNG